MAADAKRKTLAVTALDTWRRWTEDEGDPEKDRPEPTIEDLRRELMGERPTTENMLAGTAGHRVLELMADERFVGPPGGLEAGDYTSATIDLDDGTTREFTLRWELPNDEALLWMPLAEAKVEKDYETPVGLVTAKGRIDGGDGAMVVDYKFSGRASMADYFEELARSWQWRVYLDATGARRIRYEVFTLRPPLQAEPDVWRVVDRQTYSQHAYPAMGADVQRAIEMFSQLIDRHLPEYWDRVAIREAARLEEEA